MMSLLPYYPRRTFNPEAMMRTFFDDPFFRMTPVQRRPLGGMMRVDIEDKGESYLLTADMPGVPKENVKLSVENGVLTITAESRTETKDTEGEAERRYLYQERRIGSMSRSFTLEGIEEQDISAEYTDGVLNVTLPKKVEPKAEGARQIVIR